VRAYIANTDYDWREFFLGRPEIDGGSELAMRARIELYRRLLRWHDDNAFGG
jgi:hypothetical protein